MHGLCELECLGIARFLAAIIVRPALEHCMHVQGIALLHPSKPNLSHLVVTGHTCIYACTVMYQRAWIMTLQVVSDCHLFENMCVSVYV